MREAKLYTDLKEQGITTLEELREQLTGGTRPVSFANNTLRKSILLPEAELKENGLISLMTFLDTLDNEGEALTPSELNEYLLDMEEQEIALTVKGDNTYNYNGALEREVNFYTIENTEDYDTILLIAVHVGLDIRAGYTDYIAFKFDSDYQLFEALGCPQEVAYITFKLDGEEASISIDGNALSEMHNVYTELSNGDCYDAEVYGIDLEDEHSIMQFIRDMLPDDKQGAITDVEVL